MLIQYTGYTCPLPLVVGQQGHSRFQTNRVSAHNDSRKPQPAAASASAGRLMASQAMPRASHGAADDDLLRGATWRLCRDARTRPAAEFEGAPRGCAGHCHSRRGLTPPRGVRRRSRDDSGSPPPRMKLRSRSASTRHERSPPPESGAGGAPNWRLALTCTPQSPAREDEARPSRALDCDETQPPHLFETVNWELARLVRHGTDIVPHETTNTHEFFRLADLKRASPILAYVTEGDFRRLVKTAPAATTRALASVCEKDFFARPPRTGGAASPRSRTAHCTPLRPPPTRTGPRGELRVSANHFVNGVTALVSASRRGVRARSHTCSMQSCPTPPSTTITSSTTSLGRTRRPATAGTMAGCTTTPPERRP